MLKDSQSLMFIRGAGCAMAKATNLRKQADKAERRARVTADAEVSESLLHLARAYRTQADVLKAKRKQEKKRRQASEIGL
jgi:hypothetical protein